MTMRFRILGCSLLLTLAAVSCGCGGAGTGVTKTTTTSPALRPVARDASQDELLERYNSFARSIRNVNATLEMKPIAGSRYTGVIDEYHEVKAFLLAARPSSIRLIGQVPVIGKTVFDMASDGQTFEVWIPSKNKFLEGSVSLDRNSTKPIENLRPQHLVDAFLWEPVQKEESVLFEEFNDEDARYYVLTLLRGGYRSEILRKFWFDRADLNLARMQNYGPKGALLSDVRFSDWQPVDNPLAVSSGVTSFPRKIRMDRSHDEYRLDMTLSKVTINEPLDADRFQMQPPAGAEIVKLGEAKPGEVKQP